MTTFALVIGMMALAYEVSKLSERVKMLEYKSGISAGNPADRK